jgi:hypothetical protein
MAIDNSHLNCSERRLHRRRIEDPQAGQVRKRSISGSLSVTPFGDASCLHAVPNCHVGKHNAGFPCEREF